jgi:D-alanyl-lipoteichoic acid acyltransferase DltB (MBOAT superfamily)
MFLIKLTFMHTCIIIIIVIYNFFFSNFLESKFIIKFEMKFKIHFSIVLLYFKKERREKVAASSFIYLFILYIETRLLKLKCSIENHQSSKIYNTRQHHITPTIIFEIFYLIYDDITMEILLFESFE